jgi:hypothetical protein
VGVPTMPIMLNERKRMKVFNTLQEAIDSIGYGFCFICEAKHEFPNVKCDLMIGEKNE